ncbi:MAG TPA: T9SS type A sorting domain-containing protein, partial [Bacteroidia bacterium]|nr:T9SS type A sorting domain-containing protein [Bacteroidia bacterium]
YIARWVGGNFVDTCGTAVGVFENPTAMNQVVVYPNPASESITFHFFDSQQSRSIIIYDQLGREVYRENTNENLISLSVQEFAEGIYFYSVFNENGTPTRGKFVVQH